MNDKEMKYRAADPTVVCEQCRLFKVRCSVKLSKKKTEDFWWDFLLKL